MSQETSPSEQLDTREMNQVIEHGLRGQKGGIGFALLGSLGVDYPKPEQFQLSDCLREQEISDTWEKMQKGQKVWWEGGDGFGKTTFLGELGTFLQTQRTAAGEPYMRFDLGFLTHGTVADIDSAMERLDYYLGKGRAAAPNAIYMLDSADYLWEKEGNLNMGPLAQKRIEFFQKLLTSDCKVIMTAHNVESKNKKVDPLAKNECKRAMTLSDVSINELSPYYPPDKVKDMLSRVGIPRPILDKLINSDYFLPAIHHGVLSNYILGGQDNYSIKTLLCWIDSFIKVGNNTNQIVNNLKNVFIGRNNQRIQDWMTIGF